jgi:cytochrome c oxidase assembly protein subunit 11
MLSRNLPNETARRAAMRRTGLLLGLVPVLMLGLSFAYVPLFRVICDALGIEPQIRIASAATARPGAGMARAVRIHLDTSVNSALPWRFGTDRTEVAVRIGEPMVVYYKVRNLSDEPIAGTATFSVTPAKAARYFTKVECFCFQRQVLGPKAEADLPVQFYIDPAIADDANAADVRAITLSYTFFRDGQTDGRP